MSLKISTEPGSCPGEIMQLPTPERSPSPRTQARAVPSNQYSTAYYHKMDIAMVLNSSKDEQRNEMAGLHHEACSLPPMRTQLPTSTYSHSPTQRCESSFNCVSCFGLPNSLRHRPHGAYSQYSPLPNSPVEVVDCVMQHPEPRPEFKLPPIQAFDTVYESRPKRESWNGAGSTRSQLDDVLLNPKKSPRRASLSPTPNRHAISRRSPSHGARSVVPHSPRPRQQQDIREQRRPLSDDDAEDDAPSSKNSACNKPYNPVQVDWIRYHKEDLAMPYKLMGEPFARLWPGEFKTEHCFSARLYRNNEVPRVDADFRPVYDDNGEPIMESAKMREMKSPAGKARGIPFSLVERFPWRAVEYAWVSDESKAVARAIMEGKDPKDPTGREYSLSAFCLLRCLDELHRGPMLTLLVFQARPSGARRCWRLRGSSTESFSNRLDQLGGTVLVMAWYSAGRWRLSACLRCVCVALVSSSHGAGELSSCLKLKEVGLDFVISVSLPRYLLVNIPRHSFDRSRRSALSGVHVRRMVWWVFQVCDLLYHSREALRHAGQDTLLNLTYSTLVDCDLIAPNTIEPDSQTG